MNSLSPPKKLKDCKTVVDFAYRNRYLQLTESANFRRIFKIELKEFLDNNILGFDILKFDEWLGGTLDSGKSCSAVILEKYGEEGVDLVKRLIFYAEED